MRIVRFSDLPLVPWKNGGGVTRELFRDPPDGELRVRLSIAEVAADGPFSRYPGIDRSLLLLEGEGVRLTGPRSLTLRPSDPPFVFPGEDAWDCALLGGPVRDFNVMVRRGTRVSVERVTAGVLGGGFLLALGPAEVDGVALGKYDLAIGEGTFSASAGALLVRVGPSPG